MLAQQTLQTLRRLKLTGMADALEQQMAQPQTHALSFEERIGLRVDRELTSRQPSPDPLAARRQAQTSRVC